MWLALVVAVVLVGLTVAAVLGRIDGSLVEPTTSLSYVPLPNEPLTADDIHHLRLDTGLRGYRMDQVDEVIDRLGAELAALRAQLESAQQAGTQPPQVDGMATTDPLTTDPLTTDPFTTDPATGMPSAGQPTAGQPSTSPYARPSTHDGL